MSKKHKIILGVLIALLAMLVVLEANKSQPINWFPSYAKTDKIPLGTFVLFEQLAKNETFTLTEVNQPPFIALQDSLKEGSYLFVNDKIMFDKDETNRLLHWIERGNAAYIAANYMSSALLDTLDISMAVGFVTNTVESDPVFSLTSKPDPDHSYRFNTSIDIKYFDKIDTTSHKILGHIDIYEENDEKNDSLVNFIEIPYGEGTLWLHSMPQAFSNYFILQKDHENYTQKALGYLPKSSNLYWDNHYKSGQTIQLSVLYLLLGNKYLKWSYYMALIAGVLFVIFEGKRKQRSIPMITPLKNQTYAYTQTIAGMYLERKEHTEIAKKQIRQLFDFIRTKLRVNLTGKHIDKEDIETITARSGASAKAVKELFIDIEHILQQPEEITKNELLELTKKINHFKHSIHGRTE
ncbi:hypothetical protein GCM10009117_14050 [Gangjinia marincola]|uniref:DUF4350 domain-containing protein n=1 Tax=Gangjinia marincola TaxID=578463 RepID=A0ABP3XVG9_9FLAO